MGPRSQPISSLGTLQPTRECCRPRAHCARLRHAMLAQLRVPSPRTLTSAALDCRMVLATFLWGRTREPNFKARYRYRRHPAPSNIIDANEMMTWRVAHELPLRLETRTSPIKRGIPAVSARRASQMCDPFSFCSVFYVALFS